MPLLSWNVLINESIFGINILFNLTFGYVFMYIDLVILKAKHIFTLNSTRLFNVYFPTFRKVNSSKTISTWMFCNDKTNQNPKISILFGLVCNLKKQANFWDKMFIYFYVIHCVRHAFNNMKSLRQHFTKKKNKIPSNQCQQFLHHVLKNKVDLKLFRKK